MSKVKTVDYRTRLENDVKQRIVKDLAEHTITTRHMSEMYRHWRCQKPGTSNLYFDIVTWPGSLCYTGDMGDYLFQRTNDMVAFMRGSAMSFSYAAEKCVAHDGRLKEWREECFEEALNERLLNAREASGDVSKVQEQLDEIRSEYAIYEAEPDAMKAMYESGLWDELPNCKAYTMHFLWGLNAIKWFCDNVKDA